MADSYRVQITDQQDSDIEKVKSQESQNSSLGKRTVDASGSSTSGGKILNADKHSTTIGISSSSSTESKVSYSSSNISTLNNSDIFSEQGSDKYSIENLENDIKAIDGPQGTPYAKIANIIANTITDSITFADTYSKINDIVENAKDGAAQMLYGLLNQVVENNSSNNSGSTTGGSSGKSNSSAYSVNSGVTTSSNSDPATSSISGGGINPASVSLNNFNPSTSLLTIADAALDKLYNSVDYSKSESISSKSSGTGTNYNTDGLVDIELEDRPMTEWETMSYPDAMSNMYDVYFIVRSDDSSIEESSLSGALPVIQALFDGNILSARISSIEIPMYQRQTGNIAFAGNTIERPVDEIDTPGQSSFTIKGDSRLCYIAAFNELAGTSIGNFFGKGVLDKMDKLEISTINNDYKTELNEIYKSWQDTYESFQSEMSKAQEEDRANIIKEFTENSKDQVAMTQRIDDLKNEYNKLNNGSMAGFSNWAYEKIVSEDKNSIKKLQESLDKKVEKIQGTEESVFSKIKEKRSVKKQYEKYIDEFEENNSLLQKLDEKMTSSRSKVEAAIKTAQKSMSAQYKEANNKRKEKIAGLSFDPTNFDYLVEALSRNISVVAAKYSGSIEDFMKSAPHIDIVVKRTKPDNRFRTILSEKTDERFIFEDVRFLGTPSAIQFKRESTDPQEFTYEFIYKRFYKQDMYDTTGTWVASQTKALTGYVVNAVSGLLIDRLTKNKAWESGTGKGHTVSSAVKNYTQSVQTAVGTVTRAMKA